MKWKKRESIITIIFSLTHSLTKVAQATAALKKLKYYTLIELLP